MAARRAGLIAKKIEVHSKLGRRHLRTYWVRPGEGEQMARLHAMRQGGADRIVHETEAQRIAGLQAHFRDRGMGDLSTTAARGVLRYFKKADGTPTTAADFDAMFKNPGIITMPVLRKKVPYEEDAFAQAITEEVKGPDGRPLTEVMDVKLRYVGLNGASSSGFQLIMQLWATRTYPPGHPRAGQTYETRLDDGFKRTFSKRGEDLHVHHDLFRIHEEYQGGSLGGGLIKNQIKNYPLLGIKDVSVGTAWLGTYVWGRMGFEMSDINKSSKNGQFSAWAHSTQQGGNALYKSAGVKYTPEELINMHDLYAHKTYEVFGATVPLYDAATGTTTHVNIWKDKFFAGAPRGWSGEMLLEDGVEQYEHMKDYLKILPKQGTPERAAYNERIQAAVARHGEVRAQAERERQARVAREAAEQAERNRQAAIREAAERPLREARERAEAVRVAARQGILNPPGQSSMQFLSDQLNTPRANMALFNETEHMTLPQRLAWSMQGSASQQQDRNAALQARTGYTAQLRANAAAELERRYRAAGETRQAEFYAAQIQQHQAEATTRNAAEVARGGVRIHPAHAPGATFTQPTVHPAPHDVASQQARDRAEVAANRAASDAADAARQARENRQAESMAAPTFAERQAAVLNNAVQAEQAAREQLNRERDQAAAARTAETTRLAARATALGTPPEALPRRGSSARVAHDARVEAVQWMTPQQRTEWVATGSSYRRAERERVVSELSGAADTARAAYARREAQVLANEGNTRGASAARRRALDFDREALRLQNEDRDRQVNVPARQAEVARDVAKLDTRVEAASEAAQRTYDAWSRNRVARMARAQGDDMADSRAAAGDENQLRQAWAEASAHHEELQVLRRAVGSNVEATRVEARARKLELNAADKLGGGLQAASRLQEARRAREVEAERVRVEAAAQAAREQAAREARELVDRAANIHREASTRLREKKEAARGVGEALSGVGRLATLRAEQEAQARHAAEEAARAQAAMTPPPAPALRGGRRAQLRHRF